MSQPSPDAKAVVRAAEALTTQVRRIADTLSTPVVRYEVAEETTPIRCPLCPIAVPFANPQQATDHFRAQHPEQRLVGPGPWPKLATDDGPTTGDRRERGGHTSGDTTINDLPSPPALFMRTDVGATTAEDDAVAPTCWHTEPGSPCDWDRCLQPERLAAGDQGVDPATTPPLGQKLRAAADEETLRLLRRESLLVLLTRLQRGRTLSEEEAGTLRHHVETEIKEANVGREEASYYQQLSAEQGQAVSRAVEARAAAQAAIGRVRAECKAIAHEVYGQHDEDDDGKREAVGRVIAALNGTERPTTEEPDVVDQYTDPRIIGTTEGP